MVAGDRERWDAKHEAAWNRPPSPPDDFFLRSLARFHDPKGATALDLACGSGRHALELARRGYLVEAWDVSPIALESLRKRASSKGLLVATRELDLSTGEPLVFRRRPFDLVVVVDFLDRALFVELASLVAPGGHALVATFTLEREGEKPAARWCLEPGELARGLVGFETVSTREHGGRAGLLARRETQRTSS